MNVVDELKTKIAHLSLSERGELVRWLHGWQDDEWDQKIRLDAAEGKLDHVIGEVDAQMDDGALRELP